MKRLLLELTMISLTKFCLKNISKNKEILSLTKKIHQIHEEINSKNIMQPPIDIPMQMYVTKIFFS